MINQEERYRLEPPNEARPKWTRPDRPLPVIEEPRSPGAGATVGADDSEMNGGGMGPTECRRDNSYANGYGQTFRGALLASHVCAEARVKDVHSDHRDFPWSPENVLVDMVAHLSGISMT